MVPSAGHGAAGVHECVVRVAAGNGRKAGMREHVGGMQKSAAQPVADQVLRVQWVLPRRHAVVLLQGIGQVIGQGVGKAVVTVMGDGSSATRLRRLRFLLHTIVLIHIRGFATALTSGARAGDGAGCPCPCFCSSRCSLCCCCVGCRWLWL